jgi:hypothetical protein
MYNSTNKSSRMTMRRDAVEQQAFQKLYLGFVVSDNYVWGDPHGSTICPSIEIGFDRIAVPGTPATRDVRPGSTVIRP